MGRGAGAGAVGGLLSAAVAYTIGEPAVERAIAIEEAAVPAADGTGAGVEEHAEVFSRLAQQGGLVVTAVLAGVAIGLIFGLVYAVWHRADPAADPWRRAVRLALMGFVGLGAIPFLRYPANPPAVGDPATVDARTSAYLMALLVGLATVVAAWQVFARFAERGAALPVRRIAAAVVLVVGTAATWLLPTDTDVVDIPADLLWNFRVSSLVTIAALWLGLGAVFGLLGERAANHTFVHPAHTPSWYSNRS